MTKNAGKYYSVKTVMPNLCILLSISVIISNRNNCIICQHQYNNTLIEIQTAIFVQKMATDKEIYRQQS
jgi:hypothetical protein